jgi:hypothetical protein
MGRRREDGIDVICKIWGREKRRNLGIEDPKHEEREAREFLGAIRSTLGARRDLHNARATSTGRMDQHFPEVFSEDAQPINRAYNKMNIKRRAIMDLQFVARASALEKAEAVSCSVPTYYALVREAKAFVEAWLMR